MICCKASCAAMPNFKRFRNKSVGTLRS